jgi:hypothetical protein
MRVGYASQEEFRLLLSDFKHAYSTLLEAEDPVFVCTSCWLHGPPLWMRLAKGRAPAGWCEMMNNCLVQALDTALYFEKPTGEALAHFLDHNRTIGGLMAEFWHANFGDSPVAAPQGSSGAPPSGPEPCWV